MESTWSNPGLISPTQSLWFRFVKIQLAVRVQITLRQPNKNTGEWLICSIVIGSRSVKITTMWFACYDVTMRAELRSALRSVHCSTRCSWLKLLLRSRTVNILFSVFHLATITTVKIIHGRKLMNEIRARSNGGIMTGESQSTRRNTCPNTLCTTNSAWTLWEPGMKKSSYIAVTDTK
jgi:hypothetical protein